MPPSSDTLSTLQPQLTADGSFTFLSTDFGEAFHSHHGARQEAEQKFVIPTQLPDLARRPSLALLDICYGLGYNTAAALATIWAVNPQCRVQWYGLELNAAVPQAAIAHHLLQAWPASIATQLAQLAKEQTVQSDRFTAHLLLGDARQRIQQVYATGFRADAVFLDPFSPPRCPQLWTVEFLAWVARCLAPAGRLATYSCSAAVRTALLQAGLHLGSSPAVGRRSPGSLASFSPQDLPPLSRQEQEHLQTRASIPYRDPTLTDTAAAILTRRQQEQATSPLEPTSRWKARWATPSTYSSIDKIL
ncbi:MnmC family methyltransferase [Leptolyngbya sp. CCY15150]|uniref:MnmC family methyltransferase n=1 Tax=Leptolyngbya sp. CCY15150 TaxID=2767772 RepID=UPI00194E2925